MARGVPGFIAIHSTVGSSGFADDLVAVGGDAEDDVHGVAGGIPAGRHHVLLAAETNDAEFPVITVPMIVNGPAYPAGREAALNSAHVQLVASENSAARRTGSVLLTAPADWTFSHATAWPEQLSVRYDPVGQPTNGQQYTRLSITLTDLPPSRTKDGLVQLIANDGQDLVTVKVSLVWP